MKIAIILGTRPEIIKMSPLVRMCERQKINFFIIHTGQHWDKEMSGEVFSGLSMPKPKYNLGIKGKSLKKQSVLMQKKISAVLVKEKPTVVLVQGDTSSVLSGALSAKKLGIKVGHIEAGLRSGDFNMAEEVIRIIVDHISDFLFAPSKDAVKNLKEEGLNHSLIFTGNTIVEAVNENSKLAEKKSKVLDKLSLKKKQYILATVHRAENVENIKTLKNILDGMAKVGNKLKLPVIFSVHPRTKNKMIKKNIKLDKAIKSIPALGYLDFLKLEKNAALVMTDSGGLQEECFIMGIPCVTMRKNTERPETVRYGGNIVAGISPAKILTASIKMFGKRNWQKKYFPFGRGSASKKIIAYLKSEVNRQSPVHYN